MYDNKKALFIAEHNIDTIIDCLCSQIAHQQAIIDATHATRLRLEAEIAALRDKYDAEVSGDE